MDKKLTEEISEYFSKIGRTGGKNRMNKLTKEQKRELALKGVEGRWGRKALTNNKPSGILENKQIEVKGENI